MQDQPDEDQGLDVDYASLMATHGSAVRAFVSTLLPNHEDREDVLQETFLVLWSKRQQYDRTRPFVKWACGVAYRQVLKRRGQIAKSRIVLSDQAIELLSAEMLESIDNHNLRGEALERCLHSLPEKDHRLVSARYRDGLPVVKIAADMGVTESALYKSLKRIREALRDCVRRTINIDRDHSSVLGIE